MSTDRFYSDLPAQEGICGSIADSDSFIPMPSDWHIIITDVVGSTKAIEAGRYKDVNILGACSICNNKFKNAMTQILFLRSQIQLSVICRLTLL